MDRRTYLRNGLVQRGLPPHIAEGFVMNFQDESGLNPGINERNPIVPGSRGGFGLYQLTGPRRVAYERYAKERGVPVSDEDAQLDFMMMELQGPEKRAAQAIFNTENAGDAAAAIVTNFLRPAEKHRAERVARYTSGSAPQTVSTRGRQNMGLLGMMGGGREDTVQPPSQRERISNALMSMSMFPTAGMQAQMQAFQQKKADYRDEQRDNRLLDRKERQEMQKRNRTLEILRDQGVPDGDLQLAASNPAYMSALMSQVAQARLGGGEVQDPYSTIGKLQADLAAGRISEEQYQMEIQRRAPSGMSLTVGPDGTVRMTQGDVAEADTPDNVSSPEAMIANIDGILSDPALDFSTGFLEWTQNIPGTGARRFGARAAQLEGQAFLRAFDSLKGGGHITEIEGQKAQQAIGRLDTAQAPEDYRAALTELKGILQLGQERKAKGVTVTNDRESVGQIEINGTIYKVEEF